MGLKLIQVDGRITLEQAQLEALTVPQAKLIVDHLTEKKVIDRIAVALKTKIDKLLLPPPVPDDEEVEIHIEDEMPYEKIDGIFLFFDNEKKMIYLNVDVNSLKDSQVIRICNFCRTEGFNIESTLKAKFDVIKKKNGQIKEKEILKTGGISMMLNRDMNEVRVIGSLEKISEKDAREIFKKCVLDGYFDKIDLRSRQLIVRNGRFFVKNNVFNIQGAKIYKFTEKKEFRDKIGAVVKADVDTEFILFDGVVTKENALVIFEQWVSSGSMIDFNLKNKIFALLNEETRAGIVKKYS